MVVRSSLLMSPLLQQQQQQRRVNLNAEHTEGHFQHLHPTSNVTERQGMYLKIMS
jgi:hypothetical protein